MEMLFAGLAGGIVIAVLLIYIRNILYANIGMNLSTWLIATLATLIQNVTYYPTVEHKSSEESIASYLGLLSHGNAYGHETVVINISEVGSKTAFDSSGSELVIWNPGF